MGGDFKATNYPLIYTSCGKIVGTVRGSDPLDNSGLGGTKHNAWTYWGHSGSPLLNQFGFIVGLHNSWDERNGMRHAVTLEAIHWFLQLHLPDLPFCVPLQQDKKTIRMKKKTNDIHRFPPRRSTRIKNMLGRYLKNVEREMYI